MSIGSLQHKQVAAARTPAEYTKLVWWVARRVHSRLPRSVELEDLVADGFFGLLNALASFREDAGVAFNTYASHRIRGAIVDAIRDQDWMPRLARQRGDPRQKLSIHTPAFADNEDAPHQLIDSKGQLPFIEVEELDCFNDYLRDLNETHRFVLIQYFVHDRTMREIGGMLGLSESRISQLHGEAINYLRTTATPVPHSQRSL